MAGQAKEADLARVEAAPPRRAQSWGQGSVSHNLKPLSTITKNTTKGIKNTTISLTVSGRENRSNDMGCVGRGAPAQALAKVNRFRPGIEFLRATRMESRAHDLELEVHGRSGQAGCVGCLDAEGVPAWLHLVALGGSTGAKCTLVEFAHED